MLNYSLCEKESENSLIIVIDRTFVFIFKQFFVKRFGNFIASFTSGLRIQETRVLNSNIWCRLKEAENLMLLSDLFSYH